MDKATSNYERALPLIWAASQLQPSTDEALDLPVTHKMGNGLVVNYVLGEMGNLRITAAKAFHSETIPNTLFRRDGLSWRRYSD